MPKETQKVTKREAAAKPEEKKRRSKKDPSSPKRGLSAYMFFSQASRAEVKETNPEATFGKYPFYSFFFFLFIVIGKLIIFFIKIGQIGKLLGEKWGKMSDDEKKVSL